MKTLYMIYVTYLTLLREEMAEIVFKQFMKMLVIKLEDADYTHLSYLYIVVRNHFAVNTLKSLPK